jgi:AcrR family transcriptional regulator
MQVTSTDLSPAATARRAQIIASAISVISTLGYNRASFSQIAKHAGISSTRLISYHFEDKNELMTAVAQAVLDAAGDHMRPQILAAEGSAARLAAYLRANLAFIAAHPQHIDAVIQIAANLRSDETPGGEADPAIALLVRELEAGQAAGEFRTFDPLVTAVSIRAAIDAAANLVTVRPDLDLAAYADELVALFDLATRRDRPSQEQR